MSRARILIQMRDQLDECVRTIDHALAVVEKHGDLPPANKKELVDELDTRMRLTNASLNKIR